MLTLFKRKFKFLTKKEKGFLFGSIIILTITVCFNFDEIEASNLTTSSTELTYAGLFAFILAKYFFKKEEISITKKELQIKLSKLQVIRDEINEIKNIIQYSSKQDLTFAEHTLPEKEFLEKKECVFDDMEKVEVKIDTILEITKIDFIDNLVLMPLLKDAKKYLASSKTKFIQKDYAYMELEMGNADLILKNYEVIINELTETYTNDVKKL